MAPALHQPNPLRQSIKRLLTLLPKRLYVVSGAPGSNHISLTFDDGPEPGITPAILDTLKQSEARATFFVIGEKAEQHPEIIRRIIAEGHSVGSHTQHHCDLSKVPAEEALRECLQCRDLLARITGKPVPYLRPPWGKVSPLTFPMLFKNGIGVALWNKDTKDYGAKSANEVMDKAASLNLEGGDIVLMHDDQKETAEALPEILGMIKGLGLHSVPLEELIKNPDH